MKHSKKGVSPTRRPPQRKIKLPANPWRRRGATRQKKACAAEDEVREQERRQTGQASEQHSVVRCALTGPEGERLLREKAVPGETEGPSRREEEK